jgi:hypothetical protein
MSSSNVENAVQFKIGEKTYNIHKYMSWSSWLTSSNLNTDEFKVLKNWIVKVKADNEPWVFKDENGNPITNKGAYAVYKSGKYVDPRYDSVKADDVYALKRLCTLKFEITEDIENAIYKTFTDYDPKNWKDPENTDPIYKIIQYEGDKIYLTCYCESGCHLTTTWIDYDAPDYFKEFCYSSLYRANWIICRKSDYGDPNYAYFDGDKLAGGSINEDKIFDWKLNVEWGDNYKYTMFGSNNIISNLPGLNPRSQKSKANQERVIDELVNCVTHLKTGYDNPGKTGAHISWKTWLASEFNTNENGKPYFKYVYEEEGLPEDKGLIVKCEYTESGQEAGYAYAVFFQEKLRDENTYRPAKLTDTVPYNYNSKNYLDGINRFYINNEPYIISSSAGWKMVPGYTNVGSGSAGEMYLRPFIDINPTEVYIVTKDVKDEDMKNIEFIHDVRTSAPEYGKRYYTKKLEDRSYLWSQIEVVDGVVDVTLCPLCPNVVYECKDPVTSLKLDLNYLDEEWHELHTTADSNWFWLEDEDGNLKILDVPGVDVRYDENGNIKTELDGGLCVYAPWKYYEDAPFPGGCDNDGNRLQGTWGYWDPQTITNKVVYDYSREFIIQFKSGDSCEVQLPDHISPNRFYVKPNKIYKMSILHDILEVNEYDDDDKNNKYKSNISNMLKDEMGAIGANLYKFNENNEDKIRLKRLGYPVIYGGSHQGIPNTMMSDFELRTSHYWASSGSHPENYQGFEIPNNIAKEYMIRHTGDIDSDDEKNIAGWNWANGDKPQFVSGRQYQISYLNGVAAWTFVTKKHRYERGRDFSKNEDMIDGKPVKRIFYISGAATMLDGYKMRECTYKVSENGESNLPTNGLLTICQNEFVKFDIKDWFNGKEIEFVYDKNDKNPVGQYIVHVELGDIGTGEGQIKFKLPEGVILSNNSPKYFEQKNTYQIFISNNLARIIKACPAVQEINKY